VFILFYSFQKAASILLKTLILPFLGNFLFMLPIFKGVFVGITLALIVGPALLVLLQTSIHRGFKSGLYIAAGIFLSDITVLALAFFGISQVLGKDPRENMWFAMIGGIVLIIFGTITYVRKSHLETPDVHGQIENNAKHPMVYITKGYFLNIANPGVWFVWLTAMVTVSSSYQADWKAVTAFFAGTLLTVLATDAFKCFIAHRIKTLMTPKTVGIINKIVGLILIIFGTYLIINIFYDLESMVNLDKIGHAVDSLRRA